MRRLKEQLKPLLGDSAINRMLRDNGWLFGASAFSLVAGFVSGVLVARMLGIVDFGRVAIVVAFVATLNALTSFHMREFLVKHLSSALASGRRDEAAAVTKVAGGGEALMSLVAFGIAFAAAPWAARTFLNTPDGADLIRIYSLIVLVNIVTESAQGVLQVSGRFKRLAEVSTGQQLAKVIGIVALAAVGGNARQVLAVYVISEGLGCMALVIMAVREIREKLGSRWWRTPLDVIKEKRRSLLAFAVNTNVGSSLALLVKSVDVLFIGAFAGAAEAAYFSLARTLVGTSFLPVASLTEPFYPAVAREVELGHTEETKRLIGGGTRASLLWIIPSGVLAMTTIWFIVPVVYGQEFGRAAVAFALIWPGAAFAQALFWSRPTLLALGRPGYGNIVSGALCAIKIALLFVLVPRYGYVACAVMLSVLAFANAGLIARKVLRILDGEDEKDPSPALDVPLNTAALRGHDV